MTYRVLIEYRMALGKEKLKGRGVGVCFVEYPFTQCEEIALGLV